MDHIIACNQDQDSINKRLKEQLLKDLKTRLSGKFDYYDGNKEAEPLLAPGVKRAWLSRLRQPGIEQAKAQLRIDTLQGNSTVTSAFCCLGLLCEIAVEAGVIKAGEPERDLGSLDFNEEPVTETAVIYVGDPRVSRGGRIGLRGARFPELPPRSVSAWAVAGPLDGELIFRIYSKLAHANDSGLPFSDIADVIEEVL